MPPSRKDIPGDPNRTTPKEYTKYMISTRPPMFDYSIVPGLFAQSLPAYIIDNVEFNKNYVGR